MKEIFVPEAKYREIDWKNSCQSICERGECATFFWQNIEYLSSGAMGSGNATDWDCIWGYEVKDLDAYTGELKPLSYGPHFREVDQGNRERSYAGLLLRCGKRQLVVIGQEVTFKKVEIGKQLTIF